MRSAFTLDFTRIDNCGGETRVEQSRDGWREPVNAGLSPVFSAYMISEWFHHPK